MKVLMAVGLSPMVFRIYRTPSGWLRNPYFHRFGRDVSRRLKTFTGRCRLLVLLESLFSPKTANRRLFCSFMFKRSARDALSPFRDFTVETTFACT